MTIINKSTILSHLLFLKTTLEKRLKHYFDNQTKAPLQFDQPNFNGQHTEFEKFIQQNNLTVQEHLLLIIGLVPHIQPHFFDNIIRENIPEAGNFPQLGGVRGKNFRGFLPTGETALFILAGEDLADRLKMQELFSTEHLLYKKRILTLEDPPLGEPRMSGKIILSQECIELFTTGKTARPAFSMHFPAQLVETEMDWEDLVLRKDTISQIKELETWIKYGDVILNDWGMRKKLKPGYRVLFHGPPGTGKTLTASLLGKYTGKDVYKIDLSMVVSKFIGETEKNLSNLFAKAENKDWILFFDEADALFGKRTNVRDAHDKYANQEVSYLLQRVEGYNGLVILASNFKNNIDDAFVRRFQSIIEFHLPGSAERLRIWNNGFPRNVQFHSDVQLSLIASKYELSGAGIMNAIQSVCMKILERGSKTVLQNDIIASIRKEFLKEGRIMR